MTLADGRAIELDTRNRRRIVLVNFDRRSPTARAVFGRRRTAAAAPVAFQIARPATGRTPVVQAARFGALIVAVDGPQVGDLITATVPALDHMVGLLSPQMPAPPAQVGSLQDDPAVAEVAPTTRTGVPGRHRRSQRAARAFPWKPRTVAAAGRARNAPGPRVSRSPDPRKSGRKRCPSLGGRRRIHGFCPCHVP